MKTTLDLPDDLMREIKIRAARDDRKLKDLVAELLRKAISAEEEDRRGPKGKRRVALPFYTGRSAPPGQEATPEVMKQILLDEEDNRYLEG